MSCDSAIYCVNQNFDAPANGTLAMGTVIRRFGKYVRMDGIGVTCEAPGYYDVSCNVTMSPVTAGSIGIQLYADGSPIPGASATTTGTAGDPLSLSIRALVRQRCCGATAITVGIVTPAGVTTGVTGANLATVVKKV